MARLRHRCGARSDGTYAGRMKSTDGFDDDVLARIEKIVASAVDEGQAPGVVAGVARGAAVHVATAGVMAVGGPPMRRDTLFRIASMTKPMTASVLLSFVDDGLVDINEPVDRWLPELADRKVLRLPDGPLDDTVPAQRPITLRELLTFTWGFGMQGAMFMAPEPWPIFTATLARDLATFGPPQPATMPDPDTWLARLGELPLLAQPGDRWLYQTGSQVLGVLASRLAGVPFDEVLRERVLGPLGMTDTGFHAADIARLATAYERRDGRLKVTDTPDGQWARPPAFPDGGGGLVSSVDDVLAFGQMLLRGGAAVLAPATVAEMTRDQLTSTQRANVWPGFNLLEGRGWGYGMSVLEDGRCSWDGGFGTSWSNVPSSDLTVVVLTQRATDETGMPAVCDDVLAAARAAA
jgi:CubicO group peptidase (beta-lactamase class C family)